MIKLEEAKEAAANSGVDIAVIERDYFNSWFLKAIYSIPILSQNLALKGGNGIKKAYLPETRFSRDLDFTAVNITHDEFLKGYIEEISKNVQEAGGIELEIIPTRVTEKNTPSLMDKAIEIRFYATGFDGNTKNPIKLNFDVQDYEMIFLPTQTRPLFHGYSDAGDFSEVELVAYSLEEIIAEKLRSWAARNFQQDIFDVVKIIQSEAIPICKANVLSTFLRKMVFKNMPLQSLGEMLSQNKFIRAKESWGQGNDCSPKNFMEFDEAKKVYTEFLNSIYDNEVFESIGLDPTTIFGESSVLRSHNDVGSGNRDTITEAGKSKHLIMLRYEETNRVVEPYSIKFKVSDRGEVELFWGYDRIRGQRIKSFALHKVHSVSIMPEKYEPRWDVEF